MTSFLSSLTLPAFVFEQPAVSILLPVVAGSAIGYSLSPTETQASYNALRQPPGRPPGWLFGPVWTALYGLMGYGAYRAYTTGMASFDPDKIMLARHGATLYTIQLVLNWAWTPLYFRWKKPILASIDIVALTGVTAYLTSVWAKIDEGAAWTLAPYLAWLAFANYLCHGSGYLNNWDFSGKKVPSKSA